MDREKEKLAGDGKIDAGRKGERRIVDEKVVEEKGKNGRKREREREIERK